MKIIVKEKDGMHLTLPFPTSLVGAVVCSRTAARHIKKALDSDKTETFEPSIEVSGLPEESIRKFQKALKKALRKHKGLVLVEVESADGDYVKIQL